MNNGSTTDFAVNSSGFGTAPFGLFGANYRANHRGMSCKDSVHDTERSTFQSFQFNAISLNEIKAGLAAIAVEQQKTAAALAVEQQKTAAALAASIAELSKETAVANAVNAKNIEISTLNSKIALGDVTAAQTVALNAHLSDIKDGQAACCCEQKVANAVAATRPEIQTLRNVLIGIGMSNPALNIPPVI